MEITASYLKGLLPQLSSNDQQFFLVMIQDAERKLRMGLIPQDGQAQLMASIYREMRPFL